MRIANESSNENFNDGIFFVIAGGQENAGQGGSADAGQSGVLLDRLRHAQSTFSDALNRYIEL